MGETDTEWYIQQRFIGVKEACTTHVKEGYEVSEPRGAIQLRKERKRQAVAERDGCRARRVELR